MIALKLVPGLLNLQIYATVQRGFIQLAQLIQRQTSLSGRLDWRAGDLESINAGNTSFVQSFVSTITVLLDTLRQPDDSFQCFHDINISNSMMSDEIPANQTFSGVGLHDNVLTVCCPASSQCW